MRQEVGGYPQLNDNITLLRAYLSFPNTPSGANFGRIAAREKKLRFEGWTDTPALGSEREMRREARALSQSLSC